MDAAGGSRGLRSFVQRGDQDEPLATRAAGEVVEQRHARVVGRVQIVDHDEHSPLGRGRGQQAADCRERAMPIDPGIPPPVRLPAGVQPVDGLARAIAQPNEQVEALLDERLERLAHRSVRRSPLLGAAGAVQGVETARRRSLGDRLGKARRAHARVAEHDQGAAVPGARLTQRLAGASKLSVPADDRCACGKRRAHGGAACQLAMELDGLRGGMQPGLRQRPDQVPELAHYGGAVPAGAVLAHQRTVRLLVPRFLQ